MISDRFDTQADWDGSTDPPDPWGSYGFFGPGSTVINSSAAHGETGKGFRINWPTGQKEYALITPNDISSYGSEIYVGFWYRHKAPFDWGTSNGTHKWLHLHTGDGESVSFNYNRSGLRIFWNGLFQFDSNLPWTDSDGAWHRFIFRLKHNTGSNQDGIIEVWRDGTELTFTKTPEGLYDSTDAVYIGNSTNNGWGGPIKFGFQFHSGLASGQWEDWDDIIIATTYNEVNDFLGEGLLGDFDGDNGVDGADFLTWQREFGDIGTTSNLADWESNFGIVAAVGETVAVPEPSTVLLSMLGFLLMLTSKPEVS